MQNRKSKVLVISLMVSLIAIISIGSLAWFTATDKVTNTFKFATSGEGHGGQGGQGGHGGHEDTIGFSIDLYEHMPDPNNPTKRAFGDKKVETGVTYAKVLPGISYFKDPTVENTGSYDQWVRLKVTVNHASKWKAACTKYSITHLSTIFGGYEEADWTCGEKIEDATGDTLTYVYYLNRKLAPGKTKTLFTSVTIPEQFTQEDVAGMEDFTITVEAEAIQFEGTGDTPQAAFALLEPETSTD